MHPAPLRTVSASPVMVDAPASSMNADQRAILEKKSFRKTQAEAHKQPAKLAPEPQEHMLSNTILEEAGFPVEDTTASTPSKAVICRTT